MLRDSGNLASGHARNSSLVPSKHPPGISYEYSSKFPSGILPGTPVGFFLEFSADLVIPEEDSSGIPPRSLEFLQNILLRATPRVTFGHVGIPSGNSPIVSSINAF